MDIIAHGLWTAAGAKAANRKRARPLNVLATAWWGVFPDLFAFTIPTAWILFGLASGALRLEDLPRPEHGEPPAINHFWVFELARTLYNIGHSAVIFLAVFGALWLLLRRPVWELGGWLAHILLDVPTHTYRFFPTPVFWPLSGVKFSGLAWSTPWFMVLNYGLLICAFLWLRTAASARRTPEP